MSRPTFLNTTELADFFFQGEARIIDGSHGQLYCSEFVIAFRWQAGSKWRVLWGEIDDIEDDVEEIEADSLLEKFENGAAILVQCCASSSVEIYRNDHELTIVGSSNGEPFLVHLGAIHEELARMPTLPLETLRANARKVEGQ